MPTRNSDALTRPAKSLRLHAQVRFRLSHEELRRAFFYFGDHHEAELSATPYIETLARNLNFVLYEHGYSIIYDTPPENPEVADYALRCANRVWNSRHVKE